MNKNKVIYAISIIFIVLLFRSFFGSFNPKMSISADIENISRSKPERIIIKSHAFPCVVENDPVYTPENFIIGSCYEKALSVSPDEPPPDRINYEVIQPDINEKQELEIFIHHAAIQNVPIDMVTLGRLKDYYIDANNLLGYHNFIGTLPDDYEMKNELFSDLAFLYLEHGQVKESNNLIQNISSGSENDIRLKYHKSDIYLGSGNVDIAINTLLEASQLNEEPYQYTRISEILEALGDNAAASYYIEIADGLKTFMHHDG